MSLKGHHLNGHESTMLHTKFRGNRPAGSGEEDFEGVFTIMTM